MKIIIVSILITVVVGFAADIVHGINDLLYRYINIKLPFSKKYFFKKYKDRVNPIYKLEKLRKTGTHYYTIYKYELGWRKPKFRWYNYILLGSTAFQTYGYIRNEKNYGVFIYEDAKGDNFKKLFLKDSLKDHWESGYNYKKEKEKVYEDNKKEFNKELLRINKEFYENHK